MSCVLCLSPFYVVVTKIVCHCQRIDKFPKKKDTNLCLSIRWILHKTDLQNFNHKILIIFVYLYHSASIGIKTCWWSVWGFTWWTQFAFTSGSSFWRISCKYDSAKPKQKKTKITLDHISEFVSFVLCSHERKARCDFTCYKMLKWRWIFCVSRKSNWWTFGPRTLLMAIQN